MKALVIYESMFGNTEAVARAVAEGLSGRFDVTVADVRTAPAAQGNDLIVVGGPTHAFGMSRPASRRDAVRQGAAGDATTTTGIREWLSTVAHLPGVPAAAFDTKVDKPLAGSAGRKAHRALRRLGCRMVAPAESFFVTGTPGPLAEGEQQRARRWGQSLAAVGVTTRT
jgi:flavodoxin